MTHWIISDTHFGHGNCKEWCGRPDDFEDKIMLGLNRVKECDVLIHLGDVAFSTDVEWHLALSDLPGKHWLIKGNHDKRSDTWYLSNGWDFVGEMIWLNRFGKKILLSHVPQPDIGYDLNIHGHFHNSDHRRHEPELVAIKNDKQLLVKCEHDYWPYKLEKLVR